jgi:hypothetical protein
MAITLTITSITTSGGLVSVNANRSDNAKTENIVADVSSAPTALAALNIVSAAITLRASQINTLSNNITGMSSLIGQTF